MSRRQRPLSVNTLPVEGLGTVADELLNEKFRVLYELIHNLQTTKVSEPRAMPPQRAYDGQIEFCDGTNWNPLGTGLPGPVYFYDGAWYGFGTYPPAPASLQQSEDDRG